MKKKCGKCSERKPVEEFAINRSRKDGRQGSCRRCHGEYTKLHYQGNKRYYIKKAKVWNRAHIAKLRIFIDSVKSRPCKDCGRSFPPVAMDLDHVSGEKLFAIGDGVCRLKSLAAVKAEIAKCDVRCAVCHRIKTHAPEADRNRLQTTNLGI